MERAGAVFDDLFAGKGGHYARNGVMVDKLELRR